MPRFKKNFFTFMCVSTVLLFAVFDTLILMSYEYIPVKGESFELVKIIIAEVIYSAGFPLMVILLARGAVKYLKGREYYLESSGELKLFRNFVLVWTVILIANTVYLYERSKPFFKSAYDEQRKRLNALNDTKEMIQSKLSLLGSSYDSCLSYTKITVIICCVLEAFIMLRGAAVLVNAYQRQKSKFPR
ncbi:MAG: hypothetical protein J6O40_01635 [Ruminococcus sp.]|nr:hypothetical protein [Ruminococcus sp.]